MEYSHAYRSIREGLTFSKLHMQNASQIVANSSSRHEAKRRAFAVLHRLQLQHNNDVWWQFDGKERDGERIEWIAQLHVTSFAPFGCLYALFDTPLTYANKPINPAQLA